MGAPQHVGSWATLDVPADQGPSLPAWIARLGPQQRDAVLAALVTALALGLHVSEHRGALPWLLLVLPVTTVPLAWRRQRPDIVIAVSGMATGAYFMSGGASAGGVIGALFALYAMAAFTADRRDGIWSLGISLAFVTGSIVLVEGPDGLLSAGYAFNVFMFSVAWVLGDATRLRLRLAELIRGRSELLEAARDRAAADRVTAQRVQLARELHDVVGHAVSVATLQAGAARRIVRDDPEAAEGALRTIEESGRAAMAELRRMLGLIRDDSQIDEAAPLPGTDDLTALVAGFVDVGVAVDLDLDPSLTISPGLGLTVHRLVQEALTNVLRHAGPTATARVRVARRDGAVEVEVVDDGRSPADDPDRVDRPPLRSAGVGLVGLRERVALHGGALHVGPVPGGGWRVAAQLPLERHDVQAWS